VNPEAGFAFTRHAPPPGSGSFRSRDARPGPRVREKLVVADGAGPGVVEQYRKLAASLHHAQAQRGTRIVMMTSTLAAEGKTLTATNLALTLSESYRRRVALIDADLRRPTIHDMFDLPNVSGLNDVLSPTGSETVCGVFDVSPHLAVLTAGRPNPDPISGLTSERMQRLLKAASAEFEWVIVDTPPVGVLPDAGLLAGMVDAVVMVVAAGRTPYRMLARAVEAVGRERIFGVVLNRVAVSDIWGEYGADSYYGYGAYGEKR